MKYYLWIPDNIHAYPHVYSETRFENSEIYSYFYMFSYMLNSMVNAPMLPANDLIECQNIKILFKLLILTGYSR